MSSLEMRDVFVFGSGTEEVDDGLDMSEFDNSYMSDTSFLEELDLDHPPPILVTVKVLSDHTIRTSTGSRRSTAPTFTIVVQPKTFEEEILKELSGKAWREYANVLSEKYGPVETVPDEDGNVLLAMNFFAP
jgi:hypothetical protein